MADETLPPVVARLIGDTGDIMEKLSAVQDELRDFGAQSPSATLNIADDDAKAKLDDINERLAHYSTEDAKASMELGGFDETIAKLDLINAKLDETGAKDEHPKVSVDTSASEHGLGILLSSILALGPAATAVGATAAAGIAAIPGILAGIGAAGAAAYLGMSGVMAALTSTGNQTFKSFENLTPAALQFVEFIRGTFIPSFHELKVADQSILLPGLESALKTLMPAIQAIEPFILGAAKGISDFANSLASFASSSQGLTDIKAIFSSGQNFMKDLGDATISVVEGFSNLGAQAGPLLSEIGQSAERAAEAFNHWTTDGGAAKFLTYVEQVGPKVMAVIGELAKNFVSLGVALAGNSSAELTVIKDILDLTNGFIRAHPAIVAWSALLLGIGSLLAKLIGPIGTVIELLSKLPIIIEAIGTAFDVVMAADPILLAIGAAIAVVAVAAYEIYHHWAGFSGFFIRMWNDVKRAFDDAWSFIKAHSVEIAAALFIMMGPLGPLAAAALLMATHWKLAMSIIRDATSDVASFIRTVWSAIGPYVSAELDILVAEFKIAWDAITAVVKVAWDIIKGIVTTAFDIIKGIFAFSTAILTGNWTAAWNAIKNTVISVGNDIEGAVKGILGAIGGFFEQAWNAIKSSVSSAWDDIKNAVSAGASDVVSFVASLPGKFLNALSGLGNLLYGAGKAIIDGLGRGIEDAAKGVLSFVSGIAGQIASLKGPIEYDAGLLVPHGNAIMQGLAQGLQQGFTRNVAPYLSGVGVSLSHSVAPVGATSSGGGFTFTAQQPVNITVNGQQVANAVIPVILRQARATGNALGQYAGGTQQATATGINTNAVAR